MLVKLIHSRKIAHAKYFREMTAKEKTEATKKPWFYSLNDIFVDLSGTGDYTYHDSRDVQILDI